MRGSLPGPAALLSWYHGFELNIPTLKDFLHAKKGRELPQTWNIIQTLTPKLWAPVVQLASFSYPKSSCLLFPALTAATLLLKLSQHPGFSTPPTASPLPGG